MMQILAMLCLWFVLSVVIGAALGAVIRSQDRADGDD